MCESMAQVPHAITFESPSPSVWAFFSIAPMAGLVPWLGTYGTGKVFLSV